ncbi:MAG: hypothetical protein MUF23_15770 [Pirellula sp.]|nr:hypothetical protein [Pirellula sp.]
MAAWRDGDIRSLFIAILFGAVFCIGWTGSTLWPLWLSSWRLGLIWSVLACGAIASLVHNLAHGLIWPTRRFTGCPDTTLVRAQELYLQANYFEAEQLLAGFCRQGKMDPEATMLMASILRRTSRFPQALALLDELALLDCGIYWLEEIEREKKLVKQQKIRSHSDSL